MKNKSILFIVGAGVIAAAVIGYVAVSSGSDDSKNSEVGQSENKNKRDNSSNFKTVKDEKLEGELVDSFPKDEVPLYPGEIKSSLGKMDSTGERAEWNVEVNATDSFETVDSAIREAYEANNWSIASESKSLMGGVMLVARSYKHTATITYDDMGEGGVKINYGVSQR